MKKYIVMFLVWAGICLLSSMGHSKKTTTHQEAEVSTNASGSVELPKIAMGDAKNSYPEWFIVQK